FYIGCGVVDAVYHLVDVLEYLLQVLDRVFFAFFTLFAFFGLFAFFALVRLLLAGGRLVALSALLLGLQRRNRRADAHHGQHCQHEFPESHLFAPELLSRWGLRPHGWKRSNRGTALQ